MYTKSQRRWTLVDQPIPRKHHIFYEYSNEGAAALAFENEFEPRSNEACPLPLSSPNSIATSIENFFYSKIDLCGLVRITPCKADHRRRVTGLLLHFVSGNIESVGQVRLDSLDEELPVSNLKAWFLGFRRMGGVYPYVGIVSNSPTRDPDILQTIQLSDDGILEWFWSRRQCFVIYKGQQSPSTA